MTIEKEVEQFKSMLDQIDISLTKSGEKLKKLQEKMKFFDSRKQPVIYKMRSCVDVLAWEYPENCSIGSVPIFITNHFSVSIEEDCNQLLLCITNRNEVNTWAYPGQYIVMIEKVINYSEDSALPTVLSKEDFHIMFEKR